ncbi:short-chain dehydrogenase/reductase SDR [Dinoroseobacter shibae DFL 12 = DSM 16493]|jgi:NAD(P)-dependent dehydrogenase (short-subunit alcohol dehydrogenase family)|uniref:Short-chain dehydrogenase/reductase SDR n=1 Tax=Dinoroseobacter shibae (strain DSM 16493 / NCIMB 14021 / DFL 12) TaxID=398580 RepID=A8LSC1_DINSH|nr:SDR family oxidoreductase [Dinoroseobacter shibae]ABV94214.1 short-chain dehydrogenase/reductase SDR [Dinoroseobacter shibae DFL 12 = DSM 16493]URF45656.1 SDR family oxidoreductase [Dinoroseobacter shibae]URF49961.1 SDR family oxidoreductase [Dinoroseobacter shibae]
MTQTGPDLSRRATLLGLGATGLTGATVTAATAQTAPSRPLAGKVAIVSGARNNMGRAFAIKMGEMGADVVVHYHRAETLDQAEDTARLVEAAGGRAALTMGNLGQVENVRAMYDTAEQAFGGVDIVINNAGAILKKPMAEFTDAEFEQLDAINNRALFYSLREAALRMRDGGRIINIGTSLKAGAAPGYTIYSGTKAPVEEYSRMLAKELGPRLITVNTIAPGPVDTPFFHAQETEQSAAFAARLSTEQRLGRIEDIAPLAGFLASPESQWINGQTVWINGGYLTR